MIKLSVYGGSGFIGSNFLKIYPSHIKIKREDRKPLSTNILYFVSNIDNSNLYINPSTDIESNISILCEVLTYCKKEEIIFNFISSSHVYGKLFSLPAKESSRCNPKGFYSITKKCAEDLLISFSEKFNIKYRIIRLCNILGKGDKKISNKKNTLTWMVNKLKMNEKIELYDKGEQIRDIMHVKDACKAIELICTKGKLNEIYNVGSGKKITTGNFINYAKDKIKSTSNLVYIDTPKFHSELQNKHFWMDTQKLLSLGFKVSYSHEDIINELCK